MLKISQKSRKDKFFPLPTLLLAMFLILQYLSFRLENFGGYENCLEGFDAFFKIFFALDMKYNEESSKIFWIVQNLIYEIEDKQSE